MRNRRPNLVFCCNDVFFSIHLRLSLETWVRGKLQSESSVAKLRSEWSDGRVTAAAYVLTSAGHSCLVFARPTQWRCEGQHRCGRKTPNSPGHERESRDEGGQNGNEEGRNEERDKKQTESTDRNKQQARNVKQGNWLAYFELDSGSTLLKRDYSHRRRVPVILDDNRQ